MGTGWTFPIFLHFLVWSIRKSSLLGKKKKSCKARKVMSFRISVTPVPLLGKWDDSRKVRTVFGKNSITPAPRVQNLMWNDTRSAYTGRLISFLATLSALHLSCPVTSSNCRTHSKFLVLAECVETLSS